MAGTQRDSHISALEAVYNALKDLDQETRRKVLSSVYALLDMSMPQTPERSQAGERTPVRENAQRLSPTEGEGFSRNYSSRPLSLVELMQEKHPSTNMERIALFAYYREKVENLPRFSRDDLYPYFAKAKEKPPGNYQRDFVDTVRKGWIHEDGAESYITSKGIEAVESGFATEQKSKQGKAKSPARDKKTTKGKNPKDGKASRKGSK
jgi:hypothetical protein